MRRLILSAAVLLAACTPTQQAKVQAFEAKALTGIQAVASGILAAADAACADALPVIRGVSGMTGNRTVANILSYATAVCSPAGTVIPGSSIDASTASWIGGVKVGLTAASKIIVPVAVAAPAAPATTVSVPATAAPAAPPVAVSVPATVTPTAP